MRTTLSPLALALLPACGLAAIADYDDALDDRETESNSSTGDSSSGGWPGPISTLTTSPPSETEGDASTGGDTDATGGVTDATGGVTSEAVTMGDPPPGPPLIVGDPVIDPNPIQVGGFVTVTVETQDADAVSMKIDPLTVGDVVELSPGVAPGTFVGQIEAFTGLENGSHSLELTPTREDQVGATILASYKVALPKAGTEGFWETGDLIGAGEVAAMGMLPQGDVIELGTRSPQGTKSCYIRRRDPNGAWAVSDLVDLLPGVECEAVDMRISEATIFVLVRRQTNGGVLWWLAEIPTWGAEVKSRGVGSKGEEVHALAERGGTVAVCGTAPTQEKDEQDALVQLFRPNMVGERIVLEYKPKGIGHEFRETARDCVFASEDALTVVGDAYGRHGLVDFDRSQRFTLTYPISGGVEPEWVIPEDWSLHSFATAIDVAEGESAIVGYVCDDDPCAPHGRLWANGLSLSLGDPPASYLAPSDVRLHPAGYVVVASAGEGADLWAFTVRAFWLDGGDPSVPAWTFSRKDAQQLHLSRSIDIGALGEVWVGGWGAGAYPAVANIHP